MSLEDRYSACVCAAERNGAGASSTSFWCLRCSEQSLVETTTTVPCASARHWVSTCRGRSRYRSAKHSPFPNAAVAEGGLDRHWQAVLASECPDFLRGTDGAVCAWRQRRADAPGDVPGLDLVAERLDRLRWRPDPGEAGIGHRRREGGVLGEEAVAGVYRVGARLRRDLDDLADVQVRLGRRAAAERVGLVGDPHVHGIEVLVG